MKKSILLLAAALPFALSAKDVKITRPAALLDNDTLTLSFRFNVEEVKVNSEQSYTFTPVLVNGNEHLVLAPMAVSGKKNYKMPRKIRRAGRKFGFSEPYTVVYGKAADRNDIIDYTASFPYEDWMGSACLAMLQEKDECYRSAPLDIQIVEHKPVIPPLPTAYEICEPCMQMVSYLTPKAEPLKVRSEQSTLYIEYAVGATAFKDDYKNNGAELQKLKDILSPLTTGDLVTFKAINVCGYASPDGSAKTNDRVASQRAASFSDYLKKAYSFPAEVLKVTSAGEDWETLIQMLKDEKPVYADKALEIINKYSNVDTREARLKSGLGTATYRTMLNDLYPRLRRLGVSVDYEVREVENAEAAKLIYTDPKLLSLQEMYRVAKDLKPGTKEYKEVYEIAARTYPEDAVACINAASANIVSGDFQNAEKLLEKVKDDNRAWNNLGVLAWLRGDFQAARDWFNKAMSVEPEKAKANLETVNIYDPVQE